MPHLVGRRWAPATALRRPVTLLVVALAACGTAETPPPTSPPAAAATAAASRLSAADLGLEVFADYPRYLWHKRRLAIATTNLGPTPVEVTLVGLVADHFEVLAPEEKSAVIPSGSRTDLQVDFGEITGCGGGPKDAEVEIAVARPPGTAPVHTMVPISADPLDAILERECAQLAVTDAVDIAIADDWAVEGNRLLATLTLSRRHGDEAVTATSLRGSELIGLRQLPEPTEPVAELAAGDRSVIVPIAFEVIRCDPHAVGQSSRTYDFKLWVAVGDRDPEQMVLAVDESLKADLTAMIGRCVDAGAP